MSDTTDKKIIETEKLANDIAALCEDKPMEIVYNALTATFLGISFVTRTRNAALFHLDRARQTIIDEEAQTDVLQQNGLPN